MSTYNNFMKAQSYRKQLRRDRRANAAKFDRRPNARGWYAPAPILVPTADNLDIGVECLLLDLIGFAPLDAFDMGHYSGDGCDFMKDAKIDPADLKVRLDRSLKSVLDII